MNRLTIAAMSLLLLSCSMHSRPLTADEHRAEAARHAKVAERERTAAQNGARGGLEKALMGLDYDPNAAHLAAADEELRQAAEHSAAAHSLQRFEDAACAEIPAAQRSACPLLASWVAHVRETAAGVDLVLKPNVDAADTNRRLNCHLAFARSNGFARPACALFVEGMTIGLRDDHVIALSGDADVARALQAEARRIFGVSSPQPVSLR